MDAVVIVTVLALLQYSWFGLEVGSMRAKHKCKAPAITGAPEFERMFRVQQNTLEQLIIFFPALWIFGYYVSATVGAALGLLFLFGRVIYARGYIQHPDKRAPGFIIGSLATLALILGGLIGVFGELF